MTNEEQTTFNEATAKGWDHVVAFVTTLPWGDLRAELRLWLLANVETGRTVTPGMQRVRHHRGQR